MSMRWYKACVAEERDRLRIINAELLEACRLVMRPDGHYEACPCPGDYSHEHMPNNPTVAICERLRAAIAKATGGKQ